MTQTKPAATSSRTGKWKPYPAYKESGVKWLGEIPEHWEVKRLKQVFRVFNGATPKSAESAYWDGEIPWVTPEDLGSLNDRIINSTTRMITKEGYQSCGTNLVPSGSLILSTRAPIGHLAIAGTALCTNQGCRSLVFRDNSDISFFFYQLLAMNQELQSWGQGSTFLELGKSKLEAIRMLVPPLIEQRAIAAFLDRETARINALIAKKERLIELLQEKRAALISHAVTKGLDPTVPMKDSGVEWLGEIPAHWEAWQFKRVADISYGLTLELDRTETKGTPIISLPNVTKEGQLLLDDVPLTPLTSAEKKNLLLRKGDLLFNWRNGSPDHVGKTAYFNADGEYTHVSFLLRIRFDPTKYDSRYYQMFLNNLRNMEFFSSAKNRVNKTYNQTELERLEVMVPPFEEQRMIASHLDSETAKIDALISRIRDGIEKLREYSTTLVSTAVTGKIDVRDEITSQDDVGI